MKEISNTGYFVTKDGKFINPKGKELKGEITKYGYKRVSIKRKKYAVHRLVALAFIPNPENKPEIDHIDGNPQNNNVSNLRWVTRRENELNPITRERLSKSLKGREIKTEWRIKISKTLTGKIQSEETKKKRADKLRGRKISEERKIKLLKANKIPVICIVKKSGKQFCFDSIKEASEAMNICHRTIINNLKERTKSRYYIWKKI